MSNWFGDCFRKVHVLFVAPEWAPERAEKFDAKEYIKALKDAGVGVIEFYIKDHHGISYNKTAVGNPHGIDLLKPLVDEAHAAGMKFIAYYSIGWDKWAWENHPDWRVADSKQQGIMNPVTTNSGYGEFALTQLEEIARDAEIDGVFLDIYVKSYDNDAAYLKKIVEVVKKHRPEAMITFNGAGGGDDDLNKWADFSSMEAHGWHYQYQSWVSRALKREGKPVEIETPSHTLGWAGWSPKPVAMMMIEATAIAASGGSATIGLNPYPDGSVLQAEIENMGKVWHWLESIEEYLANAECVADAAVVMPAYANLFGLHTGLIENHFQYDVIKPDADFSPYPLIILYDEVALDDATREKVARYVEGGGKLLAMHDACRGLEDVLGIKVLGNISYTTSYAGLVDERLSRGMIVPLLIKGSAKRCEVTTGTALASLINPLAEHTDRIWFGWSPCNPPGDESGHPMIVHNKYGSGETLFIAAPFNAEFNRTHESGAPWLKQLLANMLDILVPERALRTSAPPMVEVVLNKQKGRHVLHLVNMYTAVHGRLSLDEANEPKIADVKVCLNEKRIGKIKSARLMPSGTEVPLTRTGDCAKATLPPLGAHTVLVIEPE